MRTLSLRLLSVALIAAFAVACGIPKEQHDKVVAEKKALETKVKETMGGKLEEQQAALKKKLDELAKTKAALEELEKMRKELEAARELDAKLRNSLKAMISAGQLEIVNVNGRLVIKMAAKILFKSGKADLTGVGIKALKQLASILKGIDRHFQVAGHTDNVKSRKARYDNWALSADRAAGVVRLLEKAGVPGKNLSAAGFSQYQPVANNRTANGKALNRRIEITLLPVVPDQVKD